MENRIEIMKAELARRRVAQVTTTVPVNTDKIPVSEKIGKGLAKTKKAVANTATNVSGFLDGVSTSYRFYSAEGVEQVPAAIITKPVKQATARK